MRYLSHSWIIAAKDLKIFVTDRLALFFSILFPFFFVILFNFMFAGIGAEDERLTLYVATQETQDGISHQIINALVTEDEAQLKPGEPIIKSINYAEARSSVEDKKLGGFLSFPADFTQGLMTGQDVRLEVITDPEAVNARAVLGGLAQAIATEVGSQQVAAQSMWALTRAIPNGDQIMERFFSSQSPQQPAIWSETEQVGPVKLPPASNWVLPGYLVMFVFFTAALGAEIIVRERQTQTLERLLTTSAKRESILGGKFLATAIKGLIQILIFWAVGILAFEVDVGISPAGVIVLSLLVVVMSAAFGIMLAAMVKTARSAISIAVLASLILAPMGGCWWPLFITPRWMQFIAKITPHAWATTGFNKLLVFGAGFGDVVPEMIALAVFAIGFAIVAVWRFRVRAM